jgi:hypothetical protein
VHFRVVYRTSKMHQMLHDGPVTHLWERFILFMLIYLPCSIHSALYNSKVLIFRLSLCFQCLRYLLFLKYKKQIYKSKNVNCLWTCEPPMMYTGNRGKAPQILISTTILKIVLKYLHSLFIGFCSNNSHSCLNNVFQCTILHAPVEHVFMLVFLIWPVSVLYMCQFLGSVSLGSRTGISTI